MNEIEILITRIYQNIFFELNEFFCPKKKIIKIQINLIIDKNERNGIIVVGLFFLLTMTSSKKTGSYLQLNLYTISKREQFISYYTMINNIIYLIQYWLKTWNV